MKRCDVCGTFNFKKNNYCTHCGCYLVEENICPYCGHKNSDSSNCCDKCHNEIFPLAIADFDDLFTEGNLALMLNAKISGIEYRDILEGIFKKLDYVEITGITPKEKILQIVTRFTPVIPKSSGIAHGESANVFILFDDRLEDSLQIGAIVHELAHFLLFELSVRFLSNILNVKESPALKAFVEFVLTISDIKIMNEYYAHTVENRFIPLDYQNFSSFNKCLHEIGDIDFEQLNQFIQVGNSYAYDVVENLEKYIDDNLRELILLQFRKDTPDVNRDVIHGYDKSVLDDDKKNSIFIEWFVSYFYFLFNNKEAREEVEYIKKKFENFS
ncbi:MAG: zinc ribbon domain-containing protein [Methanobrevibacter sp.]|uniref:zinc ribbon domain-containing protein n=1 Tax=Methanobrevibacter sp. TaxID=66852 RepID=UPI0025D1071E|nr:zinc ribbon domain-containing protein [Methanobrevibacter sp.]MBR0271877.1 zinc ribbon domain-containing protein [Methanobrevibacter sp.]